MEGHHLNPAKCVAFVSWLVAFGCLIGVTTMWLAIPNTNTMKTCSCPTMDTSPHYSSENDDTHQTDQSLFDGTNNVSEDKTTSMTSVETYRESKNSHPRVINTKAIEASNHEANTYDPTLFPEFPKVLPDFQGSSDTNMETILENNLRETSSTADEIIAGKIDNFAAKTVKAREIFPEVIELFENVKPEEKVTEAAEMKSHGSVGSNLEKQVHEKVQEKYGLSKRSKRSLEGKTDEINNEPPDVPTYSDVLNKRVEEVWNLVKTTNPNEIQEKLFKFLNERHDKLVRKQIIRTTTGENEALKKTKDETLRLIEEKKKVDDRILALEKKIADLDRVNKNMDDEIAELEMEISNEDNEIIEQQKRNDEMEKEINLAQARLQAARKRKADCFEKRKMYIT